MRMVVMRDLPIFCMAVFLEPVSAVSEALITLLLGCFEAVVKMDI